MLSVVQLGRRPRQPATARPARAGTRSSVALHNCDVLVVRLEWRKVNPIRHATTALLVCSPAIAMAWPCRHIFRKGTAFLGPIPRRTFFVRAGDRKSTRL